MAQNLTLKTHLTQPERVYNLEKRTVVLFLVCVKY